jgi:hypothetical protein
LRLFFKAFGLFNNTRKSMPGRMLQQKNGAKSGLAQGLLSIEAMNREAGRKAAPNLDYRSNHRNGRNQLWQQAKKSSVSTLELPTQ